MILIATSLVACGGNAVPPGSTNQNYGKAKSTSSPRVTQDIPKKSGNSVSGGTGTATTKPTNTSTKSAVNPTGTAKSQSPRITVAIPPVPFKSIRAETLMGLSEDAVEQKIGEPEMTRGEGPARVWQYRSEECSFDAFFFPAAEGETRKMTHMLARKRKSADKISVQDCLDQVVKARIAADNKG
ncbi:hypothetical protein AUP42_14520 [Thalassospira lucentensis]|jgi:hypothetical protein|uniref:Uncharacterized protein n=3 Tax=Thalassospira TaxID=168934 RepID=A0A154L858_9PROT|nr:hypothetical protein AUP41_03220 [Thalassospira xiamenensis]KZB66745.1 hypothetical protein AUP42_14520 [Thalassospira lucentensis]RCK51331.1 hypothetical protein TH44_07230 [Thalassospira xiamenensis]